MHKARISVTTLFFLGLFAKAVFADSDVDGDYRSLAALGTHAGYVAATVPYCGGDEKEVKYFVGQIRKMLAKIGRTDRDFLVVKKAMKVAQAKAKPRRRDCTDEGGMDLAAELKRLLDQITMSHKPTNG